MNSQPQVKELLIYKDIQGDLLKGFLKSESDSDIKVVYRPEVKKGQVKGWKKHNLQTCNIIVPQVEIRFVIFNDLNKKPFVINISDFEYDDSENKITKLNSINFDWTE